MVNGNVRWKKYFNPRNDYVNYYLHNHGDIFLDQIISKLQSAIDKSRPEIELFGFKNSKIVSKVTRDEYYDVLQQLLKICIYIEKYEYCRKIQNIIDNKNKSVSKRKRSSKMVS